jgi:hypothetical protein
MTTKMILPIALPVFERGSVAGVSSGGCDEDEEDICTTRAAANDYSISRCRRITRPSEQRVDGKCSA